jgi:hypothetical protein
MGLADLKKAELIALCEQHDLETDGIKADLVARLEPVLSWDDEPAEEVVEEVVEEAVPTPVGDGLSSEDFVREAYLSTLKREPDPSGLTHYVNCLDLHGTLTREQVLEDLANSDEAKSL